MPPSWNWEALTAAVIGAATTALALIANPWQHRRDNADAKAANADASESIALAAGEIVDAVRGELHELKTEIRGLKERIDILEAENRELRGMQ